MEEENRYEQQCQYTGEVNYTHTPEHIACQAYIGKINRTCINCAYFRTRKHDTLCVITGEINCHNTSGCYSDRFIQDFADDHEESFWIGLDETGEYCIRNNPLDIDDDEDFNTIFGQSFVDKDIDDFDLHPATAEEIADTLSNALPF